MQYVVEDGWYLLRVWGGETGYVCMHVTYLLVNRKSDSK